MIITIIMIKNVIMILIIVVTKIKISNQVKLERICYFLMLFYWVLLNNIVLLTTLIRYHRDVVTSPGYVLRKLASFRAAFWPIPKESKGKILERKINKQIRL